MIEANNLHKRFGNVVAVDGVSFRAPDGQVTGLLGPNGSGKTTTLRMLYTLVKPDSGTARVDGHDVSASPRSVLEAMGVLPDARGLYERLTTRENLEYFGRLHGMAEHELRQRADTLVSQLEMSDIEHRRVHGFSQGQRMKVAIARALVHDPQNILLDEPTNGLDVMTTRAMRSAIRGLKEQGRCVVFSSHIMQEVTALCDAIVIVARGKVVAHGSPEALREQTGKSNLEDAFVSLIGTSEGLLS